jgi:hypothetical protein
MKSEEAITTSITQNPILENPFKVAIEELHKAPNNRRTDQ